MALQMPLSRGSTSRIQTQASHAPLTLTLLYMGPARVPEVRVKVCVCVCVGGGDDGDMDCDSSLGNHMESQGRPEKWGSSEQSIVGGG